MDINVIKRLSLGHMSVKKEEKQVFKPKNLVKIRILSLKITIY